MKRKRSQSQAAANAKDNKSNPNNEKFVDLGNLEGDLKVVVEQSPEKKPTGPNSLVRGYSTMDEIDLDDDTSSPSHSPSYINNTNANTAVNANSIYESNEPLSSSSTSCSSSSLSPFSSAGSSPAESPFGSPSPSDENRRGAHTHVHFDDHRMDSDEDSDEDEESPIPVFPKVMRRTAIPPLVLDDENPNKSSFSLPMTPPLSAVAVLHHSHSKKKDSSAKRRGMVKVPSSKIANPALASIKQGAFDSPALHATKGTFSDSPTLKNLNL